MVQLSELLEFVVRSWQSKKQRRRIWFVYQQFPIISNAFVVVFSFSGLGSSLSSRPVE